jgi:hypothetical protein
MIKEKAFYFAQELVMLNEPSGEEVFSIGCSGG